MWWIQAYDIWGFLQKGEHATWVCKQQWPRTFCRAFWMEIRIDQPWVPLSIWVPPASSNASTPFLSETYLPYIHRLNQVRSVQSPQEWRVLNNLWLQRYLQLHPLKNYVVIRKEWSQRLSNTGRCLRPPRPLLSLEQLCHWNNRGKAEVKSS